jgi:hypothetical protein
MNESLVLNDAESHNALSYTKLIFYQIQMHLKFYQSYSTEKVFCEYDVKCMNILILHTQHQYDKERQFVVFERKQ